MSITRINVNTGETEFIEEDAPSFTTYEQLKTELEESRRLAYAKESDPIFFMAQRGEATLEEWFAKVNEIKSRFVYPVKDE